MKIQLNNNRGITLIALVITIIVLIILAGVSIGTILGDNGIATKARMGAQNYQNAAQEEMGLINTLLDNVGFDQTGGGSGGGGNPPGPVVYTLGQEVKVGNEHFYVIQDDDTIEATTIRLLAKYCLNTAATAQEPNVSPTTTQCNFSGDNYWRNTWSAGAPTDLNDYPNVPATETTSNNVIKKAQAYASSLGATKGELLTVSEAQGFLASLTPGQPGYANPTMANIIIGYANDWDGHNQNGSLNYWLGTAFAGNDYQVFVVEGWNGRIYFFDYNSSSNTGVRPVITINKSLVSAVQ